MPKNTVQILAAVLFFCPSLGAQEGIQEDKSIPDLFEKVNPAVVTIRATTSGLYNESGLVLPSSSNVGSGILVSPDGGILTAAHVVEVADRIVVEFGNGVKSDAEVISLVSQPDLALLRTKSPPPQGISPVKIGDSDLVRVGSQVFIIGIPFNLEHTLTVGHISARRKDETFLGSMRFIEHLQTDAAVNMGNSGGPVFNLQGEVVGLVCHLVSSSGGSEGLGFAVASNVLRDFLREKPRPWLGYSFLPVQGDLAQALNVPGGRSGLLVQRVAKDSLARSLGLLEGRLLVRIEGKEILLGGDIILEIQGLSISDPVDRSHVGEALQKLGPGDKLTLQVYRAGAVLALETILKD